MATRVFGKGNREAMLQSSLMLSSAFHCWIESWLEAMILAQSPKLMSSRTFIAFILLYCRQSMQQDYQSQQLMAHNTETNHSFILFYLLFRSKPTGGIKVRSFTTSLLHGAISNQEKLNFLLESCFLLRELSYSGIKLSLMRDIQHS